MPFFVEKDMFPSFIFMITNIVLELDLKRTVLWILLTSRRDQAQIGENVWQVLSQFYNSLTNKMKPYQPNPT